MPTLPIISSFFCDFSTPPSYFRLHFYFELAEIAKIYVSGIINQ